MALPVEAALQHDLLSKTIPAEEHSMHCIFSFIMQLIVHWFLQQPGQQNARDWLNVKDSHIFIAFSRCLTLTQMLNSAALA